jgi:hypothetical protein
MYLKQLKEVTSAARPSLQSIRISRKVKDLPNATHRMTSRREDISGLLLVNGAATEASASDKEMPMSAVFKAGASFAPSPVNPLMANCGQYRCSQVWHDA